jgi:Ca2+-binding EF-hand superfamily protein
MDNIQELYTDIIEADLSSPQSYQQIKAENTLETKLTFVEMFNKLDSNGNGYISKEEFATMSDLGYFKRPLTKLELNDLFDKADLFQSGRLNLFEFMSIMRKTVRVEIQEIGYGYLPLAWGSLAAYWIGLGMQE